MSFDDEWAKLEADAAHRTATMRLNSIPDSRGGRSGPTDPDLAHDASDKEKAASYIRETLGPDVTTEGLGAGTASAYVTGGQVPERVDAALKGWQTEKGLSEVMEEWGRQLRQLTKRLEAEASALTSANSSFNGYEDLNGRKYIQENSGVGGTGTGTQEPPGNGQRIPQGDTGGRSGISDLPEGPK